MDLLHAIILSIVEGITEFLPISSTGHMILATKLFAIPETDFAKSFEIIIQLGAILAVVVLYFQRLLKGKELWNKIIVAFLPTAIIGFALYKIVKNVLLGNLWITLASLFIGGIILLVFEKFIGQKSHKKSLKALSITECALIGLAQAVSIIPGVSRSAATIVGGMLLGLSREEAVDFSFYLAIPTMIAASGYDALKNRQIILHGDLMVLTIGFVLSFLTALVAVKFFIRFIQKHNFVPFGIYRIVLALGFWFVFLR